MDGFGGPIVDGFGGTDMVGKLTGKLTGSCSMDSAGWANVQLSALTVNMRLFPSWIDIADEYGAFCPWLELATCRPAFFRYVQTAVAAEMFQVRNQKPSVEKYFKECFTLS